MMSTQYLSSSIIRWIPCTCPSIRRSRARARRFVSASIMVSVPPVPYQGRVYHFDPCLSTPHRNLFAANEEELICPVRAAPGLAQPGQPHESLRPLAAPPPLALNDSTAVRKEELLGGSVEVGQE